MTAAGRGRSLLKMLTIRRVIAISAHLLIVGAVLAQSRPSSGADAARRALNEGRYAEVEQLLAAQTDPQSIGLRGRALVEQGKYAEAEKLLAGPAQAQPRSDAALELGLLQLTLGRRAEGTQTLRRVLDGAGGNAADFLRRARAAVALGNALSSAELFHEANGHFRGANGLAPGDPIVNAEWGQLLDRKSVVEGKRE